MSEGRNLFLQKVDAQSSIQGGQNDWRKKAQIIDFFNTHNKGMRSLSSSILLSLHPTRPSLVLS